jgi:DNA repair protein RadA/Sms
MAKIKTIYSCTECGATSPKWQGQCPGCNAWNTLVETVAEKARPDSRFESLAPAAKLQNLSEIEAREVGADRHRHRRIRPRARRRSGPAGSC